jgi:hypothetical protein
MANFVKSTDFAAKDALLTGDPAKIIKGTEIDTEFNAISVSISTKADTISPTFTGTPAAPTAATGTNTTQLATTSFVIGERSSTSTLTNKTISSGIVTSSEINGGTVNSSEIKNYTESVVSIGTVSSSHTLSLTNGTFQTAALTASTACTFTMPSAVAGKSFILLLRQPVSTGNGSATFSSVKWGTAGAPTITTTAGRLDILSFVSDGTNWYGSISQGYTY